jgi:hypothetical protein
MIYMAKMKLVKENLRIPGRWRGGARREPTLRART